ncbi:hypothetical protein [Chryseobacterium vrystaatense]|uniref:Uncharacterized protein n=1 Tax=Chryseobacterium vrystaatense TaxID=307480 RepID=A0A1M4ZI21_9FLAO|nr:hypothetical protein [Chryseobacterium vrystaatense]SHF17651.1 hypothetical protein SAMN02787073_1603 [Chryseobacterium vrystaatense]
MKIVEIEAEYIVKLDFINLLKKLIKDVESDDIINLTAEYESNFGGKLTCTIQNVELPDLRENNKNETV